MIQRKICYRLLLEIYIQLYFLAFVINKEDIIINLYISVMKAKD